eukprot:jgi/Tetstr1/421051/TSEL_012096.t1
MVESPAGRLPGELWDLVFGALSTGQQGATGEQEVPSSTASACARLVCRDFAVRAAAVVSRLCLQTLSGPAGWHRRFPELTELDLRRCRAVSAGELHALSALPALRTLRFSSVHNRDRPSSGLRDARLLALGGLPALRALALDSYQVPNELRLQDLGALAGLRELRFCSCRFRGSGPLTLAPLQRLQSLATLTFTGCTGLSAAGLACLATMPCLAVLGLDHCFVSDAFLGAAALLPGLEQLSLRGASDASDEGLAALRPLARLTHLTITRSSAISDAGVRSIAAHHRQLTHLCLASCPKVTDEGVAALAALPCMASLDLRGCVRVTSAGVAVLAPTATLQELRLSCCSQLTDAAMQALSAVSTLTTLDISHCHQVSPVGLCALRGMPHLTSIRTAA